MSEKGAEKKVMVDKISKDEKEIFRKKILAFYNNDEEINLESLSARLLDLSAFGYRSLFEQAKDELGGKPSNYDYHNLYVWCTNLLINIFSENFNFDSGFLKSYDLNSHDGIVSHFQGIFKSHKAILKREQKKLDAVFHEFAIKIENPNKVFQESLEKKMDLILEVVKQQQKEEQTNSQDSNDKTISVSTCEAENPGILYEKKLFTLFPDFEKHSSYLKEKGYYEVNETNLSWKHGKNLLLALYFGRIQDKPGHTRLMWADIEKAFSTRNLSQHYNDYDSMKRGKTSKHETHAIELINLVKGTILL